MPPPTAWLVADAEDTAGPSHPAEPYVLGCSSRSCRAPPTAGSWRCGSWPREDFVAEARALGRATAEVHTALAHALPTVTLGHVQMRALVDGMTERLEAAVQAVPALRPYADDLRSAYTALDDLASEGRTWTAQRIHGDLHLGQCLRSRPAPGR